MLIECKRHTKEDLSLFYEMFEADKINFNLLKIENKEKKAIEIIKEFYNQHNGKIYCAVSWGKDSIVVADLCAKTGLSIPLVWIKVEPIFNPYCELVRELFLFGGIQYKEYIINCPIDSNNNVHAKGTLEKGFNIAVKEFGENYITGIRSEESAIRTLRSKVYGTTSKKTCAPINYWKYEDIYAYMAFYNLPIHPNYAMLGNGRYKRKYIRVASLGGKRGRERGRFEWEEEYYPDYIRMWEE